MRGRDIEKNGYNFANLYLITSHNGYINSEGININPVDINNYPAIKKWLDSESWNKHPEKGSSIQRLSTRSDRGCTPYNLRDCAYMDDFSKQKICYSETNDAIETKIAIDDKKCITDKTCFILVAANNNALLHIYKIMSSMIFTWYMQRKSPRLGSRGISLTKDTVEQFPMSEISDKKPQNCYGLTDEEMTFIENSL